LRASGSNDWRKVKENPRVNVGVRESQEMITGYLIRRPVVYFINDPTQFSKLIPLDSIGDVR